MIYLNLNEIVHEQFMPNDPKLLAKRDRQFPISSKGQKCKWSQRCPLQARIPSSLHFIGQHSPLC
jgi:hypothetical protein